MNDMVSQKIRQAAGLLREFDLPLWIVQFARETYDHPEPVQELAVGTTVTWPAAFLVSSRGDSIAIVGTGDVAGVEGVGAYDRVVGYVQDVAPDLRAVLQELRPERIGISYSLDDDSADNMTHGMYMMLLRCLEGTPFAERMVPADSVLVALRSRKLPIEIERIRSSIRQTQEIFGEVELLLRPGVNEKHVADAVRDLVAARGATMAWDSHYDPIVNFGPQSSSGHGAPSETITLQPGMLAHVDLGIKLDGYCSDLQRMWYLLADGEDHPPESVQRPFDIVRTSMEAGFRALRPGIEGWRVDAAARKVITDAGYPEPEFALGHQLGQSTHDGGALLGPRWPRYASRPLMPLEEGNVFTVEYGLPSPAGSIGLEEDVVLTVDGADYLSRPQLELTCLRP